jgi:hypothetical protein
MSRATVSRARERFVVDPEGNRIEVMLPIADYEDLLEELDELDELDAIRAYDAAKASGDEAISAGQAFAEIENAR